MKFFTRAGLIGAFIALLVLMPTARLSAQVSGYTFSSSSGTYTEITGGTLHTSGTTDGGSYTNINIGFNFTFNGTSFSQVNISNDGHISFGGSLVSYPNIISSTTTYTSGGIVSALGGDMQGNTGTPGGELRSQLIGSAPSRVFVIQWKNYRHYAATGDVYNYQIRLSESDNSVAIVYGAFTKTSATNRTYHVGLRGINNTDYSNRSIVSGTNTWSTSSAGTVNSASGAITTTVVPSSGQTYTWMPPIQTYVSSNTLGITPAVVTRGATNQPVIAVAVVTTGSASPLSLTQLNLSTNGTTNVADIANARVYYTGTSTTFSTATQFGSTVANPNGTFTATGSQTLSAGTNYFWLTYDVLSSATLNNVIDAEATSIIVSGTTYTPTTTAPTGSRTIKDPLSGTLTVGTGGNYSTLAGAFTDINALGLSGNIIVNIISDVTETSAAVLSQWLEVGAGNYTVTIRPSGAARTVSGSISTSVTGQVTGLIFLNGADRVTIDGRVDGTGTTNGLTLNNTAATGSAAVVLINGPSVGAGSNNVTVRNCTINGGSPTVTTIRGILAVGIDNDNLTIQQNSVSKCFKGVDISGSATGVNDNLVIIGNTIGADQAADYVGGAGINIAQSNTATVSQNIIKNVISSSTVYGDGTIGVNVSASSGITVEKNRIYGIQYSGTGGYGGKGIYFATVTNGMIANNFVSGISGDGWSINTANDEVAGIKILSGSNIAVNYNTVVISGTVNTSSTTVRASAALLINTGATSDLQVRNNILMNSFVSSVSGSKAYAFYAQPAATAFTAINANDYYAGGTQAVLAYFGADRTTLSALQTATTQDANSITKEVTAFTNLATGDLHLTAIDTELIGVTISGITTDFDGETRRTPYMGADEVIPVITITQQPDLTATTCAGNTFSISTQANVTFGATISYQWIYRPSSTASWTNVVNDGVVSGATTATLTFTGIEVGDSGQYTAIIAANGKADTVYSNTQDVTVYAPIALTSHPQSTVACTGDAVVLSAVATGSITGYQWQKDGVDIAGATSAQYTITNAQASNQGTYRLRITGSCVNDIVLTNPATVTVANAAQITQNPPAQVFGCTGENITLSITATGGVGGYQWQKNGTDIAGATSAQYIIGNVSAASAGSYQVKVFPVCTGGQTVTSTATQVTFRPPVSITSQPQSLTLCTGVTANFSFTATGSIVSYQWQKNGVNIANATSAQFSIDSVTTAANGTYRGFTVGICGDTAFTNPVTLTVARPLAFSVQPVSQNVCLGENITLLAGVEGTVTSYRWQKDNVDIPGQTGPGLILNNVGYTTAGVYRLIASSPCEIVSSNNITIFVNSPTRIVRAPEDIPAAIGGTARAIVEVEGVEAQFTYQWYRGTTLLTDNGRIAGSQSSQLIISNVQASDIDNNYRVVVNGKCGTATSANFALFVPNVNITAQPSNSSVCEGGNATFTVAAQPTQSGATLSYQWMRGNTALTNGGRFGGVTTPTLTIANVNSTDAGTDYRVRITTNQGGTVVPSDYVTLTVNTIPAITNLPAAVTVCEGSELRIAAGTDGQQGLMYSWFKNNDPVGNDSVLVIPAVQAGDAAIYRVLVQNACGADTSSVEVTVDTKPSITAQPQNVNIQQGTGFTLSVTATGTGNLQYQWMKGGAIIQGATSNTYEVTNADFATHAGLYTVKITNDCGDVTSAEARVDIVNGIETTFADGFSLEANEPNPFGDATTIRFTLAAPSNVRLFVTDVFGREVAVLANGMMDAGTKSVTVNSREFDLSSGVYYYTLRTGSHIFTRQMVIVR